MTRRNGKTSTAAATILASWTLVLLSLPLLALAQSASRVYRIGWLSGTATSSSESLETFRDRLRELGWVEGRNFDLVLRHGEGQTSLTTQRAIELARLDVDVIVATAPSALAAARKATTKIPIVMVYGPDPVEAGVVSSFARPGGNITGLTSLSADLSIKQLELLKEMIPGVSRVAILWNPTNPWHGKALSRIESAARKLGIRVPTFRVSEVRELAAAFDAMAKERVGAILSLSDPMTFSHRAELAQLALEHRLPMMSGVIEYTEAGGLASYWPSTIESFRTAAFYVDRILRGAKPSELPVEQPKSLQFVINLKTAKALGVEIPPQVRARADRTIE